MTAELGVRPAPAAQVMGEPELPTRTLELVKQLCATLADDGVVYCHWKSNEALDRSMTGVNDLDLLVAREHQGRFLEVLARLGFKAAALPAAREIPAVVHYYALDAASGSFVHVHAHYRLVLGDDTTKNFWLPIERAYLDSASLDRIFPVPAPEFELAVLVLRLVLKHSTWDAMVQARGAVSASEARELEWLQDRTDWDQVEAVVAEHLPFVAEVWPECRAALEPGASVLGRVRAASHLAQALQACARRPRWKDTTLRLVRRTTWGARRYALRRPVRKRLVTGGAVVAIVGGDGAGKSTAVEGIAEWLSAAFVVQKIHLGRPPKSLATLAIKGGLSVAHRMGRFPDLDQPSALPADTSKAPSAAWLAWHVLVARDRQRLYVKSRRVAANGGVVLCDRFPMAQLHSMDGPRTAWAKGLPGLTRLGAALVEREAHYYSIFSPADVVAVLRVEPEVAVRRKTDEEENYVRRRSSEVWNVTWDDSVVVVDASQPAADVLAALRVTLWERL